MRMTALMRGIAIVAIAGTVSCDGSSSVEDFAKARARWEREGPSSYSFVTRRACFCTPEMQNPVIVVVTGGVITSRTYESTGEPVDYPAMYKDVDGLFDEIAAALKDGALVHAEYDRNFGFPLQYSIDAPNFVDEERTVTISKFTLR